MTRFCTLSACFTFLIVLNCGDSRAQNNAPVTVESDTCIAFIIGKDDSLGIVRNHACETISLEETIMNYVNALASLDFSDCPEDFRQAFERHRLAWLEVIPVVGQYPNLRGEMHDLFDQLENGPDAQIFKPLVATIWSTWREVEAAMEK